MSRADLNSLRAYLENLKQKYIQPLENELERIESIAKGAQGAQSFDNYSSMITKLNSLSKNSMNVGANILIVTLNVPDLWVSEIVDESVPYLYVNDEYFVNELSDDGKIQVGYFVLSPLETLKVNLSEYVKFTDYAENTKAGVVKVSYENSNAPLYRNSSGNLLLGEPSQNEIEEKTVVKAISPKNLDFALKVSMTTNTETWTDEEKASARALIGAIDENYKATNDKPGLVSYSSNYGMQMVGTALAPLGWEAYITNRQNAFMSYSLLDKVVMSALADCKDTSIWTEERKANARKLLGIE